MTELPPEVDPLAPYGWTVDRESGERRPKKLPGRPPRGDAEPLPPGATPSVESLKAVKRPKQEEDRAPGQVKATRGRSRKSREPAPPFRAGPIATGMNRLYLKAGKIIRAMDADIGQAIIDATKKESEDDVTVGEAWEELARTNPRVRVFLLRMITGGAWGQLFMCHAPILLAVIMKESIRKHIPFHQLFEALVSEEDGEPSVAAGLTGLTEDDMVQAMAFAQQQMASMGFPVGNGTAPEEPPPPSTTQVRVQPKHTPPRSKR